MPTAVAPPEPVPDTPGRAALALLLVVPAPSVGVVAAMIAAPGPVGTAVFVACKAWMLLLPLAWLIVVERGRPSASPARHGGFGVGALLGVAIGVVIVAGYLLVGTRLIDAGHVRVMAAQNGIGTVARYLVAAAYWITINSVLEEYVYRWFIVRRCETLMPTGLAILASALFFTVHHVIALKVQFDWTVTTLGSAGVFIGGTIWSWLYVRYRSIWPGYVSHAIVDVAVFAVGWLIIFGGD